MDAVGRLARLAQSRGSKGPVARVLALPAGGFLFESSGGSNGEVFTLDEAGRRELVTLTDSPLAMLSFAPKRGAVVVLSAAGTLSVLVHQQPVGKWLSVAHLRLASATRSSLSATMCTDDIIAFASGGDEFVRIYNIDTEENYVLHLHAGDRPHGPEGSEGKDTIRSLAFDDSSGLLAAGTSGGSIMMWALQRDGDSRWETLPSILQSSEIVSMVASEGMRSLAACTQASILVLRKYQLSRSHAAQLTAVQSGPSEVALPSKTIRAGFQVHALRLTDTHLAVFGDEGRAEVHELGGGGQVRALAARRATAGDRASDPLIFPARPSR